MNFATLVRRSLRYHGRAQAGVMLGAAVGSAVLVGALLVGDSVRYTLKQMAAARLGPVDFALVGGDRLFREGLSANLARATEGRAAPVLLVPGTAARSDGAARANRVQVLGTDWRFWDLSQTPDPFDSKPHPFAAPVPEVVWLNERLAAHLRANVGDEVVLRVQKPSLFSRDAPLAPEEDSSVALRLKVGAVAGDAQFGRFGLQASQVAPFTAFVPLRLLQTKLDAPRRANLLLLDADGLTLDRVQAALAESWSLDDAGLSVRETPSGGWELRSAHVFFDAAVRDAALGVKTSPVPRGVLTYLVNEIRFGEHTVPYSMVAALEGDPAPADLRPDEIVVNAWLAEDLGCKPGDTITLAYFVVGPMRTLVEESAEFKVRAIVPLAGAAADASLMPDFPGLKDSTSCREWDPGFPLKVDKIRDRDEDYWDAHKGTPKAFISLAAGRSLWQSRFGDLTAVRYDGENSAEDLDAALRARLSPALVGLTFEAVAERAARASAEALDFGPLFLGFSFFLIVSALLLLGLLFGFALERRTEEIGILLALGFPRTWVRRMLLTEGAAVALLGGVLGAAAGAAYARAMLYGLSTAWKDAVGTGTLYYHAEPLTWVLGLSVSTALAVSSVAFVLRRQSRRSARELLSHGAGLAIASNVGASWLTWGVALGGICGAAALALGFWGRRDPAAAGAFFGAGALLLSSGIAGCGLALRGLGSSGARFTLIRLALLGMARRPGRSLATVGLLASGTFLVAAVGAFRLDADQGAQERHSGTGGFTFYGESAFAVVHDLSSEDGRRMYALDDEFMADVSWAPFRLQPGDEASCLNLNRAQAPQVLGAPVQALAGREAFAFAEVMPGRAAAGSPWTLLEAEEPDGAIPAIVDQNSLLWALGKQVGQTLTLTNERGQTFTVRVVAALAPSVLQGSVILSEQAFMKQYPSVSGYRIFLVDAPFNRQDALLAYLSRQLQDTGMDLTPAARRLAEFNAVQNTYLSTFQVLGGLGLVLGSLGLGVVVLRNVFERRGELGVMRAVGFPSAVLGKVVLGEHAALLSAGLGCGLCAAALAVWPALHGSTSAWPVSLLITLAAVWLLGLLVTWAATRAALSGEPLAALRQE
ncbi:MAG: ABC transporter permease [Planctomycetes bacterium]|nr:ABC transporter permease [Planctomycetota bacterium]